MTSAVFSLLQTSSTPSVSLGSQLQGAHAPQHTQQTPSSKKEEDRSREVSSDSVEKVATHEKIKNYSEAIKNIVPSMDESGSSQQSKPNLTGYDKLSHNAVQAAYNVKEQPPSTISLTV